jgi:ATP-dependent RNA helicase RhlE
MPFQRNNSRGLSRPSTSRGGYSGGGRSFGGSRPQVKRGPKKEYIHPSKFVKAARPAEVVEYIATHQFSDFKVNEVIKKNLEAKGFKTPSPIQDQSIVVALAGHDVIGIANTGTGKTAAFAIPAIDRMMSDPTQKTLIMAPTRELAQQIEDECRSIGKGSGLKAALLIGGSPMGPQLRDLRANPQIVIGTPGRIMDHIGQGSLNIKSFTIVVLDEVDRMFDMGFIGDMREILGQMVARQQAYFFTATFDSKVEALAKTFTNEPVIVSVKTGVTSDNVEQNVVSYKDRNDKMQKLHDLLIDPKLEKVLIFDDTQRLVEKLAEDLHDAGFKADSIHGGKSQGQRTRAMARFKASQINILVATDVAARGIDVSDITHVINYSTPQTYDDYVHRVGRAGRAGRTGVALTFIEEFGSSHSSSSSDDRGSRYTSDRGSSSSYGRDSSRSSYGDRPQRPSRPTGIIGGVSRFDTETRQPRESFKNFKPRSEA